MSGTDFSVSGLQGPLFLNMQVNRHLPPTFIQIQYLSIASCANMHCSKSWRGSWGRHLQSLSSKELVGADKFQIVMRSKRSRERLPGKTIFLGDDFELKAVGCRRMSNVKSSSRYRKEGKGLVVRKEPSILGTESDRRD